MSLRIRLVLLIVAVVALVAMALSILNLETLASTLSDQALKSSEVATKQVTESVIFRLNQHLEEYQQPNSIEATTALWHEIVATDKDIPIMLGNMSVFSTAIVEINIASPLSEILASSNPSRVGANLAPLEPFSEWRQQRLDHRLRDIFVRRPDYQVQVPLKVKGQTEPIFVIQVVLSSVLLRDALLPQVETLGEVSAGALLVSILLTVLATSGVLRPLKRIEQTIDRIVQGSFRASAPDSAEAKEFRVVESKLNLLGEQYSGARADASELKQSLDQMVEQMATQLDVATRLAAISRLTGGLAHEIKNPLNAIALRLELLRARLTEPDEQLTSEIDILGKEVMRLDRVVKTFLDFSRPVEVRLEEVDLSAITKEITELMTPQARLAHIELSLEAAKPALIRGDQDLLKQALLNLITNAFEAMKEGGHVTLTISREGQTVVLAIADDGPGIPAEARDKVFQLYFTTKTRGSGIGLAMTYRAVQLHNGTIEFISEAGRGTTFRLRFPLAVKGAV